VASPQYSVGDIVYLRKSANVGFIEAYKVDGVRQDSSGIWFYKIEIPAQPGTDRTFGDRISLRNGVVFELAEHELCTYCEALNIAIAAVRNNLNTLTALWEQHCSESSETEATGSETTGSGSA